MFVKSCFESWLFPLSDTLEAHSCEKGIAFILPAQGGDGAESASFLFQPAVIRFRSRFYSVPFYTIYSTATVHTGVHFGEQLVH